VIVLERVHCVIVSRPLQYARRAATNIYEQWRIMSRLAQGPREQASACLFLGRFVGARVLAVLTHRLHNTGLERLHACLARNTGLRLGGLIHHVEVTGSELLALGDIYLERAYEAAPDFIAGPGWTVVDVGANVGAFALQQAQRGARVFAVEPNPAVANRLLQSVVANNLTQQMTVWQLALGREAAWGTLILSTRATLEGHIALTDGGRIRVARLDDVLGLWGIHHVDLLKIDTEGAEVAVLEGAIATLQQTDRIVLEYHSLRDLIHLQALLAQHGLIVSWDKRTDPEQGLLFATRRPTAATAQQQLM
jgi:FkbM family methyltransferase